MGRDITWAPGFHGEFAGWPAEFPGKSIRRKILGISREMDFPGNFPGNDSRGIPRGISRRILLAIREMAGNFPGNTDPPIRIWSVRPILALYVVPWDYVLLPQDQSHFDFSTYRFLIFLTPGTGRTKCFLVDFGPLRCPLRTYVLLP